MKRHFMKRKNNLAGPLFTNASKTSFLKLRTIQYRRPYDQCIHYYQIDLVGNYHSQYFQIRN